MTDAGDLVIGVEENLRADRSPNMGMGKRGRRESNGARDRQSKRQ